MAARVERAHRDEFKLVDLRARGLLKFGVDHADIGADTGAGREPVNTDHVRAVFSGGGDGDQAARAAADHEDIRGLRLDDVLLIDLRRLPEPILVGRFIRGFRRDHFNRDFALRLGDALRGSLLDGTRRDRGTGHRVHLRALRIKELFPENHRGPLAESRGFVARVNHDIRDLIGVKGHLDDHVPTNTGGL